MIDYLKTNAYNLISNLVGLFGIILAIIFYFKSKKIKKPCYSIKSFNLINKELKKLDNIEIKYLNENVDNLTATKIAIWNAGNDTIDKSDIPENAKLRIKPKNNNVIYNAEIVFNNDASNQFKLIHNKKDNGLLIDFEYLDYNQGVIIRVLHSGESSNDIYLDGKIKGVGNYRKIQEREFLEKSGNKSKYIESVIMTTILIIGCAIGAIFLNSIGWKIGLSFLGILLTYVFVKDIRIPRFPDDINTKFNE